MSRRPASHLNIYCRKCTAGGRCWMPQGATGAQLIRLRRSPSPQLTQQRTSPETNANQAEDIREDLPLLTRQGDLFNAPNAESVHAAFPRQPQPVRVPPSHQLAGEADSAVALLAIIDWPWTAFGVCQDAGRGGRIRP